MTEAAPTAQGSLEATPLGHLLVYSLDRMLTGTLVLEESNGKRHAIYFDDGGPSKAKVQDPILFLGRVLVEQKAITEDVYDRTLAQAMERGQLHGQVLLEQGQLDEHALREGLREQLSRQVCGCSRCRRTPYLDTTIARISSSAGAAMACVPSRSR
ncbi:MAG TPA: DUF4388 domain-containing protein [Polyangiaceae bacterium]